MKKTLYLYESGKLERQDNSIVFITKKKKHYLPVMQVDIINVFGSFSLNKQTISILNEYKININFFSYYGKYIGSYVPQNLTFGSILIKQIETITNTNKRLLVVEEMEKSNITNMLSVLKYYNKKYDILDFEIKLIEHNLDNIHKFNNVNEFILNEARVKQIYYHSFNQIIKNNYFIFSKRVCFPPNDPINALMSFGYALLYSKISGIIYRSSLSISLAYIHSNINKKESLHYDIADIFKPIIIDKLILRLINKKQLNAEHFLRDGSKCYLNSEGSKIFIENFENLLKETIFIKRYNRSYSYRQIIAKEVHNLSSYVNNNKKYIGFKGKW